MAKQSGNPTPVNEALLRIATPKPSPRDRKPNPIFSTPLVDESPPEAFRGRRATEADSKHRFPVLESRPTEPAGPGANREFRIPRV
ncbi:MAG: hypothetical protein HN348_13325 [Proteobacteria bacterium]|jgi:hypothetical protein|nr:hypothetical protein [Pseudomonadota bacterium]